MSKPEQLEPSMEEILASIRRAIDEDSRFAGDGPVSSKSRGASLQKGATDGSKPGPDEIMRLADDVLEIARGARGQERPVTERQPQRALAAADEVSVLRPAFGARDAESAVTESVVSKDTHPAAPVVAAEMIAPEARQLGKAEVSPGVSEGVQKGFEMATSQANGTGMTAAGTQMPRRPEGAPGPADPPLRMADVETVVASAFEKLAGQIVESRRQSTPTLEDLAKDLMRPVIKDWLDQNLATIVERMVQVEIERVTRRHGA